MTSYSTVKSMVESRYLELKNCGANSPGGGGFRSGNTCARGGYLSDRATSEVKIDKQKLYVDTAISGLVKDMNANGLTTLHSCSGHTCDRALESQIGYKINTQKKGDATHERVKELVESDKLSLSWSLQQNPNNAKMYSLHTKEGFYGSGTLTSSESTVKQAVSDLNQIRKVVRLKT